MKDTNFYNEESWQYSSKRYPSVARTYTHFFYKRRLAITKKLISQNLKKLGENPTLLEMGCADGVIVREIEKAFPNRFKKLIGIDIAPQMIGEAKNKNENPHAEFFTREQYLSEELVDLVVETGVVNYAKFDEEIAFAYRVLKPGGLYLLSVAGTGSLLNMLKHEGDFNDFRSYGEYERLLREKFIVKKVRGCGFFIPFLWRVPVLAQVVQSSIDPLAGNVLPGLCHEKVFLLRKK